MRLLCLDIPSSNTGLELYPPHMIAEILIGWKLLKSEFIRDIYFRKDRPGVAILAECDSVEIAHAILSEFPLAKNGFCELGGVF